MIFSEVAKDIKKLVGLELESIRPGAKITIIDVDIQKGNLILQTASGQKRSRPLDELRKIWEEMMLYPAVHVEGVLRGSGTSRNQPETILANLPYVEWLRIDNKKHIAYVKDNTHAFGTLKQMNSVEAIEVGSLMKATNDIQTFSMAIVSKNINQSISTMQDVCSGVVSTIDYGVYQLHTQTDVIVFLSADIYGLEEGTYCVISTQKKFDTAKRLNLYGKYFSVLNTENIKALVEC